MNIYSNRHETNVCGTLREVTQNIAIIWKATHCHSWPKKCKLKPNQNLQFRWLNLNSTDCAILWWQWKYMYTADRSEECYQSGRQWHHLIKLNFHIFSEQIIVLLEFNKTNCISRMCIMTFLCNTSPHKEETI